MNDYGPERPHDRLPNRDAGSSPYSTGSLGTRGSVRLVSTRQPVRNLPDDMSARHSYSTSRPHSRRTGGSRATTRTRGARSSRRRSSYPPKQPNIVVIVIAAVIESIANLFRPRHRYELPARGRGGSQQLHNTFRSGSAASTSSSLRTRDGMNGLGHPSGAGRLGRGPSSVIGQPLPHSHRYGRGRSTGMPTLRGRSGRSMRGQRSAISISPASLIAPCAAVAALFFVISSFVSVSPAGTAPQDEATLFDLPTLSPTEFNVSTPVSEWKRGEMPHLYQGDAAWATLPYGGRTVAANACGPTTLTMLYVYFTGNTDMNPGSMAAWADENNYAPTGATEWAFMTEGAAHFGFYGEGITVTRNSIESALEQGHPVICVVRPGGDFTDLGHYIILKSIDEYANVEVYDPNSPARSARKWDIVRVVNQTTMAWEYSEA